MQDKDYDLEPFDLQRCIAGEPVVTKGGLEFTYGCYKDNGLYDKNLVGWVHGHLLQFYDNGVCSKACDNSLNLFMKVPKKQPKKEPVVRWKWVNEFHRETEYFYTDDEIKNTLCDQETLKKLEYTRTEFPE